MAVVEAGKKVFIRTVTSYFTGEVVSETTQGITLKDAAWIADTGRLSNALKTGDLNEVEVYPGEVEVYKAGIIDISPWNHPLPRETI